MTDMITLPCRYIIVCPSMYHTCALLDGCVCQFLNFNLTDITFTLKLPTLVDFKNGGIKRVVDPDGISEITEYHDPQNELDLDAQCPAGYTWEQVEAKFEAAHKLFKEHGAENAQRTNTMIRNIHKTNIMEAEK